MKRLLQFIFSVKNKNQHKIWTIFGLKIKYRKVNYIEELSNILQVTENKIDNIEFKQNLIMDYFINATDARKATGALRKRQEDEIAFLQEFVRVCNKYNINYWLDYGSLLGAKRHGGFVPWDDDLDVSMLQKDLFYFKECWEKEEHGVFEFLFWEGIQSRIVYKNDNGSFMDIYAYDDLSDRVKLKMPIHIPASARAIPKEVVYPLSTIIFEGLEVKCPYDVDTYLRVKYGNYELLPHKSYCDLGHNQISEFKIFYEE